MNFKRTQNAESSQTGSYRAITSGPSESSITKSGSSQRIKNITDRTWRLKIFGIDADDRPGLVDLWRIF